uniref:C2 NT-type domain-containing protein n=1 Tax=Syphacia muris TaxID=451379 RepID=A0A0N5AZY5_9BILA
MTMHVCGSIIQKLCLSWLTVKLVITDGVNDNQTENESFRWKQSIGVQAKDNLDNFRCLLTISFRQNVEYTNEEKAFRDSQSPVEDIDGQKH